MPSIYDKELAMYSCADLKKGLKVMIDGEPHVVVQFDFT